MKPVLLFLPSIAFGLLVIAIVGVIGYGGLPVYRKIEANHHARQALHDPALTALAVGELKERIDADGQCQVEYRFSVPGDSRTFFESDIWGEAAVNFVSKETYDALGNDAKTIPIVYLKADPWIHEVAGDLDKLKYQEEGAFGWTLLWAFLLSLMLGLIPIAWWLCFGTASGPATHSGALGCLVGAKLVPGGTEKTYLMNALTLPAAETLPTDCDVTCALCGAQVPLKVEKLSTARAEQLLALFGVVAMCFIMFFLFTVINYSSRWLTFPWTISLYGVVVLIAAVIGFYWVWRPGFSEIVKVRDQYSSHRTFNKVPRGRLPMD